MMFSRGTKPQYRLSNDESRLSPIANTQPGGTTISPPELIARGVGEDTGLVDELREEAGRIAAELSSNGLTEIKLVQEHIHDAIGQAIYDRTRRRPMILPIVIEV